MKGYWGPEGSMGTPGGEWSHLIETTFSAPEMKSQLSRSNQGWMTLQSKEVDGGSCKYSEEQRAVGSLRDDSKVGAQGALKPPEGRQNCTWAMPQVPRSRS